jgi:hypothetical protein
VATRSSILQQSVMTGVVRRRVSDSVIMTSCRGRRDVADTTPTCFRDVEHLHGINEAVQLRRVAQYCVHKQDPLMLLVAESVAT